MKTLLLICSLLLTSIFTQAQIMVESNFECPDSTIGRHGFTGDGVTLNTQPNPPVKEEEHGYRIALERAFDFAFKQTVDGLYIGSGRRKKQHYFVIGSPDKENVLVLYSDANGPAFRQYSKWMINQARQAVVMKRAFLFLNSSGQSCK